MTPLNRMRDKFKITSKAAVASRIAAFGFFILIYAVAAKLKY